MNNLKSLFMYFIFKSQASAQLKILFGGACGVVEVPVV